MAKSRKSMAGKTKKRAAGRESTGGGFKFNLPDGAEFLKIKKGSLKLDILPYEVSVKNHPEQVKGELWYERTVFVHYNIGIDDKSILCPKTIGKPCPICEEMARMKKDSSADEDDIKALKPKERQIFNVRDPEDEDKVVLFEMSYFLFGQKLEEEIREGEDEWAGFADMEGGYTLKVRFTEKKLGKNAFLEASRIDFKERDDLDEDVLDNVYDLDAILNVMDYEPLENLFLGINSANDEKEEEEEEEEVVDKKKKDKKKDKKKEEPELDVDELMEMSKFKMKKFIEKNDMDIDDDLDKDEMREAIAKALDIELPDPDKNDEVELSLKDLLKMDKKGMKNFIKDHDLTIKKYTKMDEDELKESLANMYDLDLPDVKKDKKKDDGECPHGHTFGKDCDEHDDCDDCKVWSACKDASEG